MGLEIVFAVVLFSAVLYFFGVIFYVVFNIIVPLSLTTTAIAFMLHGLWGLLFSYEKREALGEIIAAAVSGCIAFLIITFIPSPFYYNDGVLKLDGFLSTAIFLVPLVLFITTSFSHD